VPQKLEPSMGPISVKLAPKGTWRKNITVFKEVFLVIPGRYPLGIMGKNDGGRLHYKLNADLKHPPAYKVISNNTKKNP